MIQTNNQKLGALLFSNGEAKPVDVSVDTSFLERECLNDAGELIAVPAEIYHSQPFSVVKAFAILRGFYVLPTVELIDWLTTNSIGRTIEIGAGHGCIGKTMGITTTDLRLTERPKIKQMYEMSGQPIHTIPSWVKTMDGMDAVRHYKAETVIGGYITQWSDQPHQGNIWGIKEDRLIKKVKRYIMIGNHGVHGKKGIMPKVSQIIRQPWIVTRSAPEHNAIYVWDK